jgi:hypothetical protein
MPILFEIFVSGVYHPAADENIVEDTKNNAQE